MDARALAFKELAGQSGHEFGGIDRRPSNGSVHLDPYPRESLGMQAEMRSVHFTAREHTAPHRIAVA